MPARLLFVCRGCIFMLSLIDMRLSEKTAVMLIKTDHTIKRTGLLLPIDESEPVKSPPSKNQLTVKIKAVVISVAEIMLCLVVMLIVLIKLIRP